MPRKELEEVPRCQTEDSMQEGAARGSREWNRPSVPTIGLVDACLEIANRGVFSIENSIKGKLTKF